MLGPRAGGQGARHAGAPGARVAGEGEARGGGQGRGRGRGRVGELEETPEALRARLARVRGAMGARLAEADAVIAALEAELEAQREAVGPLHAELGALHTEIQALCGFVGEISQNHEANLRNGEMFRRKLCHLAGRMDSLGTRMEAHLAAVGSVDPRRIPLVWVGSAADVRVMGSFDGWTRGVQLVPSGGGSGRGFVEFSGELCVCPGQYEVKFLVDGEYRLAPDWERTSADPVKANNVLVVE